MAELPALPLFTDAYLADCDHLTDVEHGRYLLMLMHMWRAPNRRFPNDDAWLARKFRRPVEAVRAELRPLIDEFFKTDGNWIYHKRLEREHAHVTAQRAKQSARAKSRWEKEKGASRGNAPTPTPTPKESNPPTPLEPAALAPARKRGRKPKVYPAGFEAVWAAYPRRAEDDKQGCAKHYLAAVRDGADEAAILEGAERWAAATAGNEYRIGLRRWLASGKWSEPPPRPRGRGSPPPARPGSARPQAGEADLLAVEGLAPFRRATVAPPPERMGAR